MSGDIESLQGDMTNLSTSERSFGVLHFICSKSHIIWPVIVSRSPHQATAYLGTQVEQM